MKLPAWSELIPQQKDILEHPLDKDLFVVGPPGSGKTILAVSRAEMAAKSNDAVALVTYNRMLRRLAELLHSSSGVDTKTMHSFVWRDYKKKTGQVLELAGYAIEWSVISTVLEKLGKVEKYQHVVIDEGQDLPQDFFKYIRDHAASIITVFADEEQALGDKFSSLKTIRDAAALPDPVILSVNHRNSPEIANVAKHFHRGNLPVANVRRGKTESQPALMTKSLQDTVNYISTWFKNRGGTVGVLVKSNDTGSSAYNMLKSRHPGKVHIYTNKLKNEDSIPLIESSITVLNKESVKGQEFDTVFILELEQFLPCASDTMYRVMYMLCTRARDHLFLVSGVGGLSPAARKSLPDLKILE